jgi:hypothetical protein
MRRWAEAHVGRGAGSPASTSVPRSTHRSFVDVAALVEKTRRHVLKRY